jgi:hypothetical protein
MLIVYTFFNYKPKTLHTPNCCKTVLEEGFIHSICVGMFVVVITELLDKGHLNVVPLQL